jgi:two-component sensor histidine kinase
VKEADHRIANHLTMLASLVQLNASGQAAETAAPTAEGVQLLLGSIRVQIEAIAQLHRTLMNGGDRLPTDLGEMLTGICASLSAILPIQLELTADLQPGCWIRREQVLPVGQIVAEAVTNAVKHAFAPGQVGTIKVQTRQNPLGPIVIEVMDNGGGPRDGFDAVAADGLGFRLIRALSARLGATFGFESACPGGDFLLTLPIEPAPRQVIGVHPGLSGL